MCGPECGDSINDVIVGEFLLQIATSGILQDSGTEPFFCQGKPLRQATSFLLRGLTLGGWKGLTDRLQSMRLWDGKRLPRSLQARLDRYAIDYEYYTVRIRELEAERRRLMREYAGDDRAVATAKQLFTLRGVGINTAWLYSMEFFSWRTFRNGKEVGSLAGLTPTPKDSGKRFREQGIGKDGSRHIRGSAIEFAWGWLRFQPDSELSKWYERRFGLGSTRMRKVGIVALARKLLIAMWRYVETGVIPEGAVLKTDLRVRW